MHVGSGNRDEVALLAGTFADDRADDRVGKRNEDDLAVVEVVREPAAVALARQVKLADDPQPVGLEHDSFNAVVHASNVSAATGQTVSASAARSSAAEYIAEHGARLAGV